MEYWKIKVEKVTFELEKVNETAKFHKYDKNHINPHILGLFWTLKQYFNIFSPDMTSWLSQIELDTPQPKLLKQNENFNFSNFRRWKNLEKKRQHPLK